MRLFHWWSRLPARSGPLGALAAEPFTEESIAIVPPSRGIYQLYRDGERVGSPVAVRLERGATARVLVRDRVDREGVVRYRAIVDDPERDVWSLPLLDAADRRRIPRPRGGDERRVSGGGEEQERAPRAVRTQHERHHARDRRHQQQRQDHGVQSLSARRRSVSM